MRAFALAMIAAALAAAMVAQRSGAGAAEPVRASKASAPMLGISYRSAGGALAWFDPLTLRTLPGRKARLGGNLGSWSFSADRGILAIASCGDAGSRPMRFINPRAMRVLGDLRVAPHADCMRSLTWLRPRRMLVVVDAAGGSTVVVVDPVARCVLRRVPLPTAPWTSVATTDELVLLLAEHGSFAAARVVAVDADGRVRTVRVERVLAGSIEEGEDTSYRSRIIEPGLAVDPGGRRAFLVPASGPVAEVDLVTLEVSYHDLDQPSLLGRFLRWLSPAAQAKIIEGPIRNARWLGGGMIAVSGMDYSVATAASGEARMSSRSAGLRLIDTRSWTSRMLEREASGFAVAADLVVAEGGRWDSELERGFGPGLRAFDLGGTERWQLRSGENRWMETAGAFGYVYFDEDQAKVEIVDLATGRVVQTLESELATAWPQLLAEQSSNW